MSKYNEALRKIEENRSKNSPYPFSQLNLDPPKPESRVKKAVLMAWIVFLIGVALVYALGLYLEKRGPERAASPAEESFTSALPASEPKVPVPAAEVSNEASFDQFREFFRYIGIWTLPDLPNPQAAAIADAEAVMPPAEAAPQVPAEPAKKAGPYFTVQVATFKTQARAKEEAAALGKKGYEAFVLQANKFFTVCVNRFDTKQLASKTLSEVRAGRYTDAYVRSIKQ